MIAVNSNIAFALDSSGFIKEVYQYEPLESGNVKILTGLENGTSSEIWEIHPQANYVFVQPNGILKPQYVNGKWVETATDEELGITIAQLQQKKIKELEAASYAAILENFPYVVNGTTYYFPNDDQAQKFFDKLEIAFRNGYATSPENFTCYDSNGNVCRIPFDSTTFPGLYGAHLKHISDCVSRFRDVLEPQVMQATTVDQINAITW